MQSYLFTCSNSKQHPNDILELSTYFDHIEIPKPSSIEVLSFHDSLFDIRKEILSEYEQKREQLDWNKTLPAWRLYSGSQAKFFPRITKENWQKDGFELLIFSTLFGWIKHTDRLPYYSLDLKKSPLANFNVLKFWENNTPLLLKCIPNNSIDLLPATYRLIFNSENNPLGKDVGIKFTDRGDQKGVWLNEQLNLLP